MSDDVQEKAKILVVDDVPARLMTVQAVLESLQQTVVAVTSGTEALRRLLADDFAVILLDVNMPDLGGFETAELIRKRKQSEHTPIIFLTAYADDAYAQRGYALGAVDYLLTPAAPDVLRAKVSVFVELFHKTRQIQRQADERVELARAQAARVEAERANLAKSQFLTNISHELRTPLTAIIGMTELALVEPLDPTVKSHLDTVHANARLLLELLNEILDLSKLEAGKLTLENAPLNLRKIVAELGRTFGRRAEDKHIRFHARVDRAAPNHFIGDSLRLRQVLINLLSNALKFTERGEVTLDVHLDSSCDREAWVRFVVADTGIGIAPADQDRIFSPFTQLDASNARRHDGAGLGLAIAAELIRVMAGTRSLVSEPGRGSAFTFTIPLAIDASKLDDAPIGDEADDSPAAVVARLNQPYKGAPLRVLLAEDTRTNQMLVTLALAKRGHRVEVAEDGRAAIELVKSGEFDVILMDLQMPGVDGLEATAAIRQLPGMQHTPIIALTAHSMVGDRERCLAAGMEGYLSKPLDLNELYVTVETAAAGAAARRTG